MEILIPAEICVLLALSFDHLHTSVQIRSKIAWYVRTVVQYVGAPVHGLNWYSCHDSWNLDLDSVSHFLSIKACARTPCCKADYSHGSKNPCACFAFYCFWFMIWSFAAIWQDTLEGLWGVSLWLHVPPPLWLHWTLTLLTLSFL